MEGSGKLGGVYLIQYFHEKDDSQLLRSLDKSCQWSFLNCDNNIILCRESWTRYTTFPKGEGEGQFLPLVEGYRILTLCRGMGYGNLPLKRGKHVQKLPQKNYLLFLIRLIEEITYNKLRFDFYVKMKDDFRFENFLCN